MIDKDSVREKWCDFNVMVNDDLESLQKWRASNRSWFELSEKRVDKKTKTEFNDLKTEFHSTMLTFINI